MRDISVIIPYYNAGQYIGDAVNSVITTTGQYSYEIIIVNDGSTEKASIEKLNELLGPHIQILHQENKGPAAARNTGIRKAQSDTLLLLDADNKIVPGFIEQGIQILSSKPEIDIVYGQPSFFGVGDFQNRKAFTTKAFDLYSMWHGNYIDMCSIIRTRLVNEIGYLDESPEIIGHEDWEYWLRAGIEHKQFFFIDAPVFEYRFTPDSLITRVVSMQKEESWLRYIYGKNYKYFLNVLKLSEYERGRPLRTFCKNLYNNFFKKY